MTQSVSNSVIQRALEGDRRACETLFKEHAPTMFKIAKRYLGNPYDAKDVVHDAFVKAIRKLDTFKSDKGKLGAWLARIVANESLSWLRREKLRYTEEVDDFSAFAKTGAAAPDKLQYDDIIAALEILPSGARTVFNMAVFEGYNHNEIGEALGITASASRAQLTRARNQLKSYLAPLKSIS